MKNNFNLILFAIFTIIICSCKDNIKKNDRLDLWYTKLKNEIIENSKQKEDSVSYKINDETLFITYFLKGYRIRQEYKSLDTSRLFVTKGYGQNNDFELRSEISQNGLKRTEGITYKNYYYGPWTVWYENGEIMYKGRRYRDDDYDIWTYYFENGELKKNEDNKRIDLTDSILNNENLKTTKGWNLGQPEN
jgi:hypothetical protein